MLRPVGVHPRMCQLLARPNVRVKRELQWTPPAKAGEKLAACNPQLWSYWLSSLVHSFYPEILHPFVLTYRIRFVVNQNWLNSIKFIEKYINLTITNWILFWSLHMKPPRILGGHFKKIEKSYKFSQKTETSSRQSNNSNYNSHQICYLFL